MRQLPILLIACVIAFASVGCAQSESKPMFDLSCPVTEPNGNVPPGEKPSPSFFGNGALWTGLWPNGTVLIAPRNVESDGSLSMKFFWWRGVKGALTLEGKRLDAPAPPLRSHIPDGYGDTGFQASAIIFPTSGCWQVTGKAGDASLTFITRVVQVDKLPWE